MLTATPISKDLMPAATGAQLTCFPADSPASHSALPGSARAIRMTVRSGLKCSALLTKSDPVGLLVRTLLASPRWASTACYLTWKRRVTPAKQFYYQLLVSAPRTVGTDFGFLPTPTACLHNDSEDVSGWLERRERVKLTAQNGNGMGMPLAIAVKLLPTPTVNDAKNASLPESQRNRDGLAGSILRGELLPTPVAQYANGQRGSGSQQTSKAGRQLPAVLGGSLNPRFVAQMMGYPPDWCELAPVPSSSKPTVTR